MFLQNVTKEEQEQNPLLAESFIFIEGELKEKLFFL